MPHTELATGWAADTPVGDNFLLAYALNMAEQCALDAEHLDHRSLRTDAFWAADYGVPSGMGNTAVLLQPLVGPPFTGASPAEVLDEIEAFYRGGRGEVLLFSPWPTPDLRERGWHLHGHPPLMIRPPGGSPAAVGNDLRVERVTGPAGLADFALTVAEAFPLDDVGHLLPDALFPPAALDDDRFSFFVGYEHDRPVATALTFVAYGHNDVTAVSVRPECRGKGYGEAVTWAATLADPARPAALLASDPGRPVYERMGYVALLRFTLWGWGRP